MIKRESSFGLKFRHWVRANAHDLETCSFELKQTKTDSLPFAAFEEHQVNYSLAIRKAPLGVLTRVEAGTIGAPDYFYHRSAPAYLAIKYPLGFVIMDVPLFLREKEISKRKSLTWERACQIAWKVVK